MHQGSMADAEASILWVGLCHQHQSACRLGGKQRHGCMHLIGACDLKLFKWQKGRKLDLPKESELTWLWMPRRAWWLSYKRPSASLACPLHCRSTCSPRSGRAGRSAMLAPPPNQFEKAHCMGQQQHQQTTNTSSNNQEHVVHYLSMYV